MALRPEMRRYLRRLAITMIAYAVILVGVITWFRTAPPTGVLAYVAAILPALPIAALFVVIGRLFVELSDEYVRMLLVRQSLVATGFALSACTVWGFLEGFVHVPHMPGYWAAVLWFSGLGVGGIYNAIAESRARA